MLKAIRSLNFGWTLVLFGILAISSGLSMSTGESGGKTFLCFDDGCIYVQGISNIVMGIFSIILGIYLIRKK